MVTKWVYRESNGKRVLKNSQTPLAFRIVMMASRTPNPVCVAGDAPMNCPPKFVAPAAPEILMSLPKPLNPTLVPPPPKIEESGGNAWRRIEGVWKASTAERVSEGTRSPSPPTPTPKSPMEEMLADLSAEALETVEILLCPVSVDCWVKVRRSDSFDRGTFILLLRVPHRGRVSENYVPYREQVVSEAFVRGLT